MYTGKIYIEAGHNNRDSGAVGVGGRKESDWTKWVKIRLADALIKQSEDNVSIIMDDDGRTLSQVISDFKRTISSNDILLSIHFNSASSNTATGTETFIADGASERSVILGKDISKIVADRLGIKNRGCKTESQSNRGRLGILHLKGSAVLLEVSFINNPEDVKATEDWIHWALWDLSTYLLDTLRK
jgi:N-acetylmuramoyl-L-alanine amidase